jgi:hypothetical protein
MGRISPCKFQTSKFKKLFISFYRYFRLVVKKIIILITSRPKESIQLRSEFNHIQFQIVYLKQALQELNVSIMEFLWCWTVEVLKFDDAVNKVNLVTTHD